MAGSAFLSCASPCQSSLIALARIPEFSAHLINCSGVTSCSPSKLSWISCVEVRCRPWLRATMTRHSSAEGGQAQREHRC